MTAFFRNLGQKSGYNHASYRMIHTVLLQVANKVQQISILQTVKLFSIAHYPSILLET